MCPCLSHKDDVIRKRLGTRFLLEDSSNERWMFLKHILGVTNIDETLKEIKLASVNGNITAGNAEYYKVPAKKKWEVISIWREGTSGLSRLFIQNESAKSHFLLPSQTSEASINNSGLTLLPNWTINMSNSGNGSDSSITVSIIYKEEDAY